MCGNNSGLWIIIILVILFSCGGYGFGCGNNCCGNNCCCDNGCGNNCCSNNCCC